MKFLILFLFFYITNPTWASLKKCQENLIFGSEVVENKILESGHNHIVDIYFETHAKKENFINFIKKLSLEENNNGYKYLFYILRNQPKSKNRLHLYTDSSQIDAISKISNKTLSGPIQIVSQEIRWFFLRSNLKNFNGYRRCNSKIYNLV